MNAPAPHHQQEPHVAPKKAGRFPRKNLIIGLVVAMVIAGIGSTWYLIDAERYVYTDKAEIEAPLIALGSQQPGTLRRVFVHVGDTVRASQTVAMVGDETINAQVDGLVVDVKGDIGAAYQPGQGVITMIQPTELRVVARIDEDKGLKDVYTGQNVIFTLDAYGSRKFSGTVESVSPTKRADDVVFSISDKRETKQFDVKIRYGADEAMQFQNGMSARVWIVK